MRPLPVLALFAALVLVASPLSAQGGVQGQVLKDQYGKDVRIEGGRGRPLLLLVSDRRDSTQEFSDWARALSPLAPTHGIQALANLKAIPFFLPHELIASSLRKDLPDLTVLLDWKGTVFAALSVPANATSLVVLSPSGKLVGVVGGALGPASLEEARRLAARALGSP